MKEQEIQRRIKEYLEEEGAYVVKVEKASKRGVADLLACYKGKFLSLEVKRDEGVVAELQKYNLLQVKKAGGISAIVYSVDEVKTLLRNI